MSAHDALPPIPPKRYFTIGEVSELCGVKPHVLRYWEQEFTQLRPMKRRGNRRYYQHHEVLLIRRIRELLYDQGFTIHGARNRLAELAQQERGQRRIDPAEGEAAADASPAPTDAGAEDIRSPLTTPVQWQDLIAELRAIRALLDPVPASAGKTPENTI
ncbi:MAG: MerR family transcriptional regulator [Tepidimonas sp.]|uniref:MerR family transcriptional regulator n=1 Tax=Tepidimonas sp. TaxID=2002775 RepID=UPI004054C727